MAKMKRNSVWWAAWAILAAGIFDARGSRLSPRGAVTVQEGEVAWYTLQATLSHLPPLESEGVRILIVWIFPIHLSP